MASPCLGNKGIGSRIIWSSYWVGFHSLSALFFITQRVKRLNEVVQHVGQVFDQDNDWSDQVKLKFGWKFLCLTQIFHGLADIWVRLHNNREKNIFTKQGYDLKWWTVFLLFQRRKLPSKKFYRYFFQKTFHLNSQNFQTLIVNFRVTLNWTQVKHLIKYDENIHMCFNNS